MKEIMASDGTLIKIDCEWFEMVSALRWTMAGKSDKNRIKGYAKHGAGKKGNYLHHIIMDPIPRGMVVDHIDGDTYNNQRKNLRHCTHSQNLMNRKKTSREARKSPQSRFKGVSASRAKWEGRISIEGQRVRIGRFETEIEAAMAYNQAALKYYGEFARLNIVDHAE